MRKDEKASVSTIKIICISLILLLFSGIGVVMAANSNAKNVKIVFANGYELNIITTKTKVADILNENHIVLENDETTNPKLESNLSEDTIYIVKEEVYKSDTTENNTLLGLEQIKDLYSTITEKIVTMEVEIPYETITKDISGVDNQDTITKVLQEGQNGIKVITYKITYKDDIEVDKLELESKIVKEPVNKIVQINKKAISRAGENRTVSAVPQNTTLAQKVENIEPKVITMNASAYTASTCGKAATDKGYGYTSSGAKAQAWYTVAAGKGYPIGTVMYIPYFKNQPNGGWFVVQDRGGAISNNRVDIYMDTYNECKQFGRKNLECYVYEF